LSIAIAPDSAVMVVSSNNKWSWADENRDILTQGEAGNPAVGERYANTPADQMMLLLSFCRRFVPS
jgi:hypothetical protein